MPRKETRLQYLYHRFIRDEATAEELREFWRLMQQAGEDDPIRESVFDLYGESFPENIGSKDWGPAFSQIISAGKNNSPIHKMRWWWAAASLFVVLSCISYLLLINNKGIPAQQPTRAMTEAHDVAAPDASRATLTLADGSKIYLDSTDAGTLVTQNHVQLRKTADEAIVYDLGKDTPAGETVYNTLSNPRGSRVIHLTLSDGSHLWLNAGSSATFPVAFSAQRREISITGEAYFEVAHDASKTFVVNANGVKTEVLGTHFNVNAYDDEDALKITLLEGSVKVTDATGNTAMVKPGQQATEAALGKWNIYSVDVEEVIAWKNERFSFNDTGIKDIMREVARWYDVTIKYSGDMTGLSFGGNMSRQKNVSELLKRMEATDAVRFEVNGKEITVIKKP